MIDDIKKTLWAAADKPRVNLDAAEYKHIVLGLICLKYISNTFTARRDQPLVEPYSCVSGSGSELLPGVAEASC